MHRVHILQLKQFSQPFSGGQSHPFEPAPGHSSGALETGDGVVSGHGGVHDSHTGMGTPLYSSKNPLEEHGLGWSSSISL